MCALPARSMPGSEMLFVENTRIRGTWVSPAARGSVATGAVIGIGLQDRRDGDGRGVGRTTAPRRVSSLTCGG